MTDYLTITIKKEKIMNIRKMTLSALAVTAGTAMAAMPEVSNVVMKQADNRLVTITYELSAPAVVTLDIQTNANTQALADDPGWTSIGGEIVCNAQGDVWKKVSGKETYTITWQADRYWAGKDGNGFKIAANGARARVTAWPLDNTPDYMVVDISAAAQPDTQRYYTSTNFLPGGLLGNDDYRTTCIVMRKIMAKDVTWTMGSTSDESKRSTAPKREDTHMVQLDRNYYIGVFEVTQSQWALIRNTYPSVYVNPEYRAMRPVEKLSYNAIRNSSDNTANSEFDYPADPNPDSFLGLLRTRTRIDFDLPSEAQWEFASRAGNGATKWGNGTGILNADKDENLDKYGRYQRNGGKLTPDWADPAVDCGPENGTAIVGSYEPNDWGLYDMAGNVYEWCLDWFEDDITNFKGKVNIDENDSGKTLSGAAGSTRVRRGGTWHAASSACRPAYRNSCLPSKANDYPGGFRLVCPVEIQ